MVPYKFEDDFADEDDEKEDKNTQLNLNKLP